MPGFAPVGDFVSVGKQVIGLFRSGKTNLRANLPHPFYKYRDKLDLYFLVKDGRLIGNDQQTWEYANTHFQVASIIQQLTGENDLRKDKDFPAGFNKHMTEHGGSPFGETRSGYAGLKTINGITFDANQVVTAETVRQVEFEQKQVEKNAKKSNIIPLAGLGFLALKFLK